MVKVIIDDNVNVFTKMISFNCKSLKRSVECIKNWCKYVDIIALQETWLLPHEISILGHLDLGFSYVGKSAVDTSLGILRGRPYGGVALLWRKSLFKSVTTLPCASDRIVAIKATTCDGRDLLLFSVYMPTNSVDNLNEFCECLSETAAIVETENVESVYILGDFNAHPGELFSQEMLSFCDEQSWCCADYKNLGIDSDTFTFVSDACGSRRWLDHCLVSEAAWRSVEKVEVYQNAYWSDHFPLCIQVNLGMVRRTDASANLEGKVVDKVRWGERCTDQINCYYRLCMQKLRLVDFPAELSNCCDNFCLNKEHTVIIDNLYKNIVTSLREAAEASSGYVRKSINKRTVIGWNRHVRDAHGCARVAFKNWVWHGKPQFGQLFIDMRETRKIFKQQLKYCQDNEEQIKLDIIASEHKKKQFNKFWKSTQKLNTRPAVPLSVNGVSEPAGIADMFRVHFSVTPRLQVNKQVGCGGERLGSSSPIYISAKEIGKVIKTMTRGKSPGHDNLSIEHFQHAGPHLPRVLSMLYNFCIRHSYLPAELMRTIVVPIVKNKTGDVSDKENYRPISLATITAKVLDSVLERRMSGQLILHDAQFGFRAGLSTETAILALKHTVSYYTSRNTPVYAVFLDLSKAFDLVNYNVLWTKLRDREQPEEIVELLRYWYNNQINQVRWSGALSETYGLACGVRQGGLTSPALFSLYVDQLIGELSSTGVGCSVDGKIINSISYADDMVLLSPSIEALRRLLEICERYALTHGLLYNVKKSVFMVFGVNAKGHRAVPPVYLYGVALNRVSCFRYLGHILVEDLNDDQDIERERRALSVRCNMLARRFARCTRPVKITLFKAYCQTFYTCSLWVRHTQRAYNALRVQYNNAFRVLLGLPRFCSASAMFAESTTDSFSAIMRKRTASLLRRIRGSANGILRVIGDRLDGVFLEYWTRMHTYGSDTAGKYMN